MPTTKRVATTGVVSGAGGGVGTDTWGRSWGLSWWRSWFSSSQGASETPASPAIDSTPRVAGAVTRNYAQRVHHYLELEGDESGYLLLEGDMQESGHDVLMLEGDAIAIGGSATKRVAGI